MTSTFLSKIKAPILIFVAALLIFGSSVRYGFLNHDDDQNISQNPRLQVVTLAEVASFWKAPYLGLYIPVTYSYWAAGAALSHLLEPQAEIKWAQGWIFHLGNVLLHGFSGVLLYYLLRRFGFERVPAVCGSLLFVLHPLQVEAVTWATGGKDVLAAFLALVSLHFYAGYLRFNNADLTLLKRPLACYIGALAFFALAVLAKPSAAILPLLFLVMEVGAGRRLFWAPLIRLVPLCAALAVFRHYTIFEQVNEGPFVPVDYWARPLVAGDAALFYLRKLLVPLSFAVDYGRRPELVLADRWLMIAATLPYAAGLVLWWLYPRAKLVAGSAAVFMFALLPTLGFMPFAFMYFSTVADRYAYLAVLGAALLVTGLIQRYQHPVLLRLVMVALLGLAGKSLMQVQVWESETSLFSSSVAAEPKGAIALVGLSNDVANKGDWPGTEPLLQRAKEAMPNWGRPYNNLGTTYLNLNRLEESAAQYRLAIHYFPSYPLAHSNLCAALAALERLQEAEGECQQAIGLAPEFDMAYLNLGFIYAKRQLYSQAEASFAQALRLNPASFKARRNLASAQKMGGNCQAAITQLRQLRQMSPGNLSVTLDLGNCYEQLGQKTDAQVVYQAFVQGLGNQPVPPELAQALANLQ